METIGNFLLNTALGPIYAGLVAGFGPIGAVYACVVMGVALAVFFIAWWAYAQLLKAAHETAAKPQPATLQPDTPQPGRQNPKELILPPGHSSPAPNTAIALQKYSDLRAALDDRPNVGTIYKNRTLGFLKLLRGLFSDHGQGNWTAGALDRLLLLAIIYPIMSLLVVWYMTGVSGPTELALGLAPGTTGQTRAFSAIASILFVLAFLSFFNPPRRHKGGAWLALRAGCLLGSYAALLYLGAVVGVGVGLVVVAGAFAFAGPVAGPVAGALAGALAIAGAVESAVAVAVAFAVAVALALAVLVVLETFPRHQGKIIGLMMALYLLIFPPLVYGIQIYLGSDVETPLQWVLLVFLGALPLLNAGFDWLSIGVTRAFLRRGVSDAAKFYHPLLYAVLDIICAIVLLYLLMLLSIGYIQLLNYASISAGGQAALAVEPLLIALRDTPYDSTLIWVYVTIFTTFIPSLCNMVLGFTSLIRRSGIFARLAAPTLNRQADIPQPGRTFAAGFLALEWGAGALLAGAFAGCLAASIFSSFPFIFGEWFLNSAIFMSEVTAH